MSFPSHLHLTGLFMFYFKEILEKHRHISICFHTSDTLSISSPSFKKQNKTRNYHHFLSTKPAVELQLSCFSHVTLQLRLLKSNMIWKQVGQPSQGLVRPQWSVSHKYNICTQPSLQFNRKKHTHSTQPHKSIYLSQHRWSTA